MAGDGILHDVPNKKKSSQSSTNTKSAVLTILAIFLCSVGALIYVYMTFPELDEDERQYIKVPYEIEDAKNLGKVLERYKDKYFFEVLMAVLVTYIFLQTFAIPGSISLSILSGFLFPFPLALGLVCFCSATGASLCYLMSYFIGRRLIHKYFPEKAKQCSATVMVVKHREDLFSYMIFLRVTPILPNWFINIVAPVIDVPLTLFWLGTFIGVIPPSFLAIQTGKTLHELSGTSGGVSWTSAGLLLIFAVLSLVPVILKNRFKKKFD